MVNLMEQARKNFKNILKIINRKMVKKRLQLQFLRPRIQHNDFRRVHLEIKIDISFFELKDEVIRFRKVLSSNNIKEEIV